MSHQVADQAVNTTLGTAILAATVGVISQEQLLSVGAILFTVGGYGLKFWQDLRTKRRNEDAADADAKLAIDMKELAARRKADLDGVSQWKQLITSSAEELGDARADLKAAKLRILELEQKLSVLADSQKAVVATVNKQTKRVAETVKKVGELQQAADMAAGSSSGLNLPTLPADDGTNLDMPNVG